MHMALPSASELSITDDPYRRSNSSASNTGSEEGGKTCCPVFPQGESRAGGKNLLNSLSESFYWIPDEWQTHTMLIPHLSPHNWMSDLIQKDSPATIAADLSSSLSD